MTNVEKIKAIFYDYAQGIERLEISKSELDEIAKRIETEVMGIQDDNEFVNLTDLTKKISFMEFKEIKFEHHPEWDSIAFTSKWIEMVVNSANKAGDISITISALREPDVHIFLTQENIQQLITHLQKQLE